jgi:hypothetical protein
MTDRARRRAEARKLAKKRKKQQPLAPSAAHPVEEPASISTAQLAANQANAQLSTGPKSDAGKAISSRNNLRHGLTQSEGELILLDSESPEEYARSLAAFEAEWQPSTATEHDLVERLASRQWLRRRAMKLQTSFLAPDGLITDEKQFALYRRYEVQHERAFNKALSDLIRLRGLRLREQNGFESQRRKDEIHAYKIKALKDRELRNQYAVLEAECRLTLAQGRLCEAHLLHPTPISPETEQQSTAIGR